jgi:UDP-hydrolysing UDP-N-acetyl-D-glucosamine 2-epimerase
VLTTGRQDYGILRSSLVALRADPRFELAVWAGGMHTARGFGRTIDRVRADGMPVVEELDFAGPGGAPAGHALEVGSDPIGEAATALAAVGAALERHRPDALVLLGDRSETLAAGLAATLARVPIVHLHGGEESEGAIDNAMRHALTKLAHLHLVSHEDHARRVRQLGEDPASVVVVGAGGLDNLHRGDLPTRGDLEARLALRLADPIVVVTVHPTTLATGSPTAEVEAVAAAMAAVPATYVVSQPNADAGGAAIRAFWTRWCAGRAGVALVDALGEQAFWGLLKLGAAMLGNSSAGIIEAPSAGLPVVNVGERQAGRLRSAHVTDVAPAPDAIAAALRAAIEPATRSRLAALPGPYPAGAAAPRIVDALARWRIPTSLSKRFHGATP